MRGAGAIVRFVYVSTEAPFTPSTTIPFAGLPLLGTNNPMYEAGYVTLGPTTGLMATRLDTEHVLTPPLQ